MKKNVHKKKPCEIPGEGGTTKSLAGRVKAEGCFRPKRTKEITLLDLKKETVASKKKREIRKPRCNHGGLGGTSVRKIEGDKTFLEKTGRGRRGRREKSAHACSRAALNYGE